MNDLFKHDFDTALKYFNEALAQPSSPQTPKNCMQMVNVYARQSDFKNALKYAKLGLKFAKKLLPSSHELIKNFQVEISNLRSSQRRKMYKSCLTNQIKIEKENFKRRPHVPKDTARLIRVNFMSFNFSESILFDKCWNKKLVNSLKKNNHRFQKSGKISGKGFSKGSSI